MCLNHSNLTVSEEALKRFQKLAKGQTDDGGHRDYTSDLANEGEKNMRETIKSHFGLISVLHSSLYVLDNTVCAPTII